MSPSSTELVRALVDTRQQYNRVFAVYAPVGIAVFAVILLVSISLLVKNRRRPPESASRRYEADRLEGGYAVFLTCVVVFLLYFTYSAEHQTDTVANRQRPALTINVTASRWEWMFQYPAYGITIHSGTTGMGTFVVPTGEAVRFTLSSQDVIHAFWIPEVRFKHDLIYGRTQYQTLVFPSAGVFQGQCAVFCGLRHAEMLFSLRALTPAQFERWARSRGKAALS